MLLNLGQHTRTHIVDLKVYTYNMQGNSIINSRQFTQRMGKKWKIKWQESTSKEKTRNDKSNFVQHI
jgi:hypothetical protein